LKGFPVAYISYIKKVFGDAHTVLQVRGKTSPPVHPGRGTRQGDLLSPLHFNLVMDIALSKLNSAIGFKLFAPDEPPRVINRLGYADDLILIASTPSGLQNLLKTFEEEIGCFGLWLSHEKCKALSLVPNRKLKIIKVETRESFKVIHSFMQQLGPTTKWEYLGVPFESKGVLPPKIKIGDMLRKISVALLKTHQCIVVLRGYLLPRYAHSLAFGRVSDKMLRSLDLEIRRTVRRWLKLPHDVPVAYMHA
jgi:hypothetical protein